MDANSFSIVANMATLLTALATLFAVLEMRRQRKSSFRPDLVVVNESIVAEKHPTISFPAPIRWHEPEVIYSGAVSVTTIAPIRLDYSVRVYNLGTGPAKDLIFEWSFDLSKLVEAVNSLSQRLFAGQFIELTSANWLKFTSKSDGSNEINLDGDLKREEDFLLPSSIIHSPCLVRLPSSYINLISSYVQLSAKSGMDGIPNFQIPPLCLKMTFRDMDGSSVHRKFSFGFELIAVSVGNYPIGSFHAILKASSC